MERGLREEAVIEAGNGATDAVVRPGSMGLVRRAAPWVLAGALAFPIAVLSHEFGHYLAYRAFGVQGLEMHFGSVTSPVLDTFWELLNSGEASGASELVAPWKVAIGAGMGLAITYLTLALCWIGVRRPTVRPWAVAVGLVAPVRILSGIPTLLAFARGETLYAGTDEGSVARLTGLPPWLLVLAGVAALIATVVWIFRGIPRGSRAMALTTVVVGIVVGGVLYVRYIGPALLP